MPELSYLLGAALLSALLLSLGALAGFWAGQRILVRRQPATTTTPIVSQMLAFDLDRCLTGGFDVAKQTATLMEVARTQATPVPATIVNAIQKLGDTTQRLVQQLDQMQRAQAVRPTPTEAKQPIPLPSPARDCLPLPLEIKSSLTREEISVFTGQPELNETRPTPHSQRHPYECSQYVAPWNEGDPIPLLENMFKVRCHDISIEGISFFLPDRPGFDLAVISLGNQLNPTLMVIEIRHSKVVFMKGDVQHLVGCRFVRRVEHDSARRAI